VTGGEGATYKGGGDGLERHAERGEPGKIKGPSGFLYEDLLLLGQAEGQRHPSGSTLNKTRLAGRGEESGEKKKIASVEHSS